MLYVRLIVLLAFSAQVFAAAWVEAQSTAATATATAPTGASNKSVVGEKTPSEDAIIKDFHALGPIAGHDNLFRCASPVRELVKHAEPPRIDAGITASARARMQHLYERGIRTIVSLEAPEVIDRQTPAETALELRWIELEKTCAEESGIKFVARPMTCSGPKSLQDTTDAEAMKLLDAVTTDILNAAKDGGVVFHCAAGHDRTGIVAAYLRMKYQHWTADQAIEEMRKYGHNWVKFSRNGGVSSWLEDHLRGIALLLKQAAPESTTPLPEGSRGPPPVK